MLTYTFENKTPLYESLYKQIKEDIHNGKLKPHEKLPSKRTFAKHLNISTITIENAYAQLMAEGYIYSKPKSGFYVSDFIINKKKEQKYINYQSSNKQNYIADFVSNEISVNNFPFSIWGKLTKETLLDNPDLLMKRSPSIGLIELRKAIAAYLYQFRGMNIHPDQIIIGAGTEYLYGLLIQLLGRNKIYALEDPGYQTIRKIYESYEVNIVTLPLDNDGINIDKLKNSNANILHISPSHHFPTGIVTPIKRRSEILKWANAQENRYIIEDDYDSEFRLVGKPIPTLQSIDNEEKVIYMNTFSKSLTSTIRISYMVLPHHLIKKYQEQLSFYSCTVSNFEQLTLAKFIEKGYFERHINRMRNFYKTQRNQLIDCILKHPHSNQIKIREENSGLHFLIEVNSNYTDEQIIQRGKEKGIRLACLSNYTIDKSDQNIITINYSKLENIEQAVNILFEVIKRD